MGKEELIERVLDVMRLKGVQAIRMSDLPTEAKISAQMLKKYFKTKEEVFSASIGKVILEHTLSTKKIIADSSLNPVLKVAMIYKKGLKELMLYHPSFFFHLKKRYKKLYDQIEDYNRMIYEVEFPKLLEAAKSEGFILKGLNVKVFCSIQLSQSRLIIENIYPQFYQHANEIINIQLLNLRAILNKQHITLLDDLLL